MEEELSSYVSTERKVSPGCVEDFKSIISKINEQAYKMRHAKINGLIQVNKNRYTSAPITVRQSDDSEDPDGKGRENEISMKEKKTTFIDKI